MTFLYSRQTDVELLQQYCNAIDLLTINPENRLKRKVENEVERTQIGSWRLNCRKSRMAKK